MIAIDRNDHHVTLASSLAPRVDFEADGRARTEWLSDGSTISTRAVLYGDQLVVATSGNWGNDYSVTFEPMDDGRSLRLTRHIYDVALAQPVTVESFYRRSSDEADWDMYSWTPGNMSNVDLRNVDAPVPNGTRLVATLEDALSTRESREGDRFTLTIRSPSPYQGAVIAGFVAGLNDSGRVSGRAEVALGFQTIRLQRRQYPRLRRRDRERPDA